MPEAMQLPQSTYDPTQGLGVLNMALGLQQKKIAIQQAAQNLQTGQYNQQIQQAGAQTSQITAQGQTEAAGFFSNMDPADWNDSRGVMDVNKLTNTPQFAALS